jgi:AraC family transcriptional regulator of adaptative response/methylated-DNA-[protein]-cysteine methyltransferase
MTPPLSDDPRTETPAHYVHHVRYGFFDTRLGTALLAATPRGLCALRLGPSAAAEEKLDEMRSDFPGATICEAMSAVQSYADQLVAFLEGRSRHFQPRLDVLRGTAFQRRVWEELRRVEPGETLSYTDLAARVGRPSAVRAVAGACAQNGIAVAIPCHRVLRRDGSLAGYRWGKEWKRRLLEMESRAGSLPGVNGA